MYTERGGTVVTHETRIREVPGSSPGADQPDWGFFVVFLSQQGKCWVGFSLPRSIWPLFIKFIYHKIKFNELNKWNINYTTIEIHSLLVHTQGPYTRYDQDVEASLNNNELKKSITITSINRPIPFLPNSGKLDSPRSRVSLTSVTDQLYSVPTKNFKVCLKKFSLKKR